MHYVGNCLGAVAHGGVVPINAGGYPPRYSRAKMVVMK